MAGVMKAYSSPTDWYDDALDWQKPIIATIRDAVGATAPFEETIKYGNLFFLHAGAAMMLRHEENRLIFGFFRGKRMRELEPRLKASGNYELANITLKQGDQIEAEVVRSLAQKAAKLNEELGDPTARR